MKKITILTTILICFFSMTVFVTASNIEKKILYWQVEKLPVSYNPSNALATIDRTVLSNVFEGLTRLDENGVPQLAAAEKVDISENGTVYTFTIRKDAYWSYQWQDVKVTAKEFERGWKELANDCHDLPEEYRKKVISPYHYMIKELNIKSFKALDDNHFQVVLTKPTPYFLTAISRLEFAPNSQAYVETKNVNKSIINYAYNGPFKVYEKTYTTDGRECIVLRRNQHYWNKDAVKIDEVVIVKEEPVENRQSYRTLDGMWIKFEEKDYTNQELFKNGVLHLNNCIDNDRKEIEPHTSIVTKPINYTKYLTINTTHKALKKVGVRKALDLAFDRSVLLENSQKNNVLPAYRFIPRHLFNKVEKDQKNTKGTYDYYIADTLLSEAGYPKGTGFPTLKVIVSEKKEDLQLANCYKKALKDRLNIDITVSALPREEFIKARKKGEFDLLLNGWIADYDDPYTYLRIFKKDSPFNYGKWSGVGYENALKESEEALGDQRIKALLKADAILFEDSPVISLYHSQINVQLHESVIGLVINNDGTYYFGDIEKQQN